MKNRAIAVYCASSGQVEEIYKQAARLTGTALAGAGHGVVYGGGHVGLMGIMADAALENGGKVTGVITAQLHNLEVAHQGLSELHIVDTMQQRQKIMADLADGFVILPGGLGTLAEFFEVLTWKQLHLHEKPIILVNINDYWAPLNDMIAKMVEKEFLRQNPADLFTVCGSIEEAIEVLA